MRWVAGFGLLLAGCVANGTYQGVVDERDGLKNQVADLKAQVDSLQGSEDKLKKQAADAQSKLDAANKQLRQAAMEQVRTKLGLQAGQKLHANLQTSMGDIPCELWPDAAPNGVTNFVGLAEGTKEWTDPRTGKKRHDPLYDGTIFHRVIKGFMIQGGDPLGNGMGGPGYEIPDEIDPEVRFDQPGLLAYANAGPNTNGSQFFVTTGMPDQLNGHYVILGKCELDTVHKIEDQPVGPSPSGEKSAPKDPVKLRHVQITRG